MERQNRRDGYEVAVGVEVELSWLSRWSSSEPVSLYLSLGISWDITRRGVLPHEVRWRISGTMDNCAVVDRWTVNMSASVGMRGLKCFPTAEISFHADAACL